MNGYITKPIRPAELFRVLERWLYGAGNHCAHGKEEKQSEKTNALVLNFDDLVERLGDEETAGLIMEAFLQEMPNAMDALTESMRRGDAFRAGRNAHTIKGVAGNIGGEALREAAFRFETAAKGGDEKALPSFLEKVLAEYRALKDEVERMLKTLGLRE